MTSTRSRRPHNIDPVTSTNTASVRMSTVVASLTVALIGLAASTYLTIEHFTSSLTLACPESATINCQKVTTSKWSHIAGIPVAVLGLVFFVVLVALFSPPAWRRRSLDIVRVGATGVGVLSALYLVWIELYRVNAICLWCTAVHVCTLILFGLALWGMSSATNTD
jgi:uncharacterized membrane protein